MQLKPHIIYKPLSRLWILILNGWICQYKARKISMKLISWSNSINGDHKNQIYIAVCVGSASSKFFKNILHTLPLWNIFFTKISPFIFKNKSPKILCRFDLWHSSANRSSTLWQNGKAFLWTHVSFGTLPFKCTVPASKANETESSGILIL